MEECTAKPWYDIQWFSNKDKAISRKGRGLRFRCQTPQQENKLTAWIKGAMIPNFNCSSIYILFFQLGYRNLNWNKYQAAYLTVKYPIQTRAGVQRFALAKYGEFIAGHARPTILNCERKLQVRLKVNRRGPAQTKADSELQLKLDCLAPFVAYAVLAAVVTTN